MKSIQSAWAYIRTLKREIKSLREALAAVPNGEDMLEALQEAQAVGRNLAHSLQLKETQLRLAHEQLERVKDTLSEMGVIGAKQINTLNGRVTALSDALDDYEEELEEARIKYAFTGLLLGGLIPGVYIALDKLGILAKLLG